MAPSLQGEKEFYSCFKEAGAFLLFVFHVFRAVLYVLSAFGLPALKGLTSWVSCM